MASVKVGILHRGAAHPKTWEIAEKTLKQRSGVLRDLLPTMPATEEGSPKDIHVRGSFGPMSMVLDEIAEHGHKKGFKVTFRNLSIEQVAMLWQATEILDIMPKQIDLRAHLRGWVSHEKLTPQQIISLHIIFESSKGVMLKGEKLSNWNVLIHQTAYMIDDGRYTTAETDEMEATITAQAPALAQAILDKIIQLKERRTNYERASAKAEQRKIAEEANRRVAEHKEALRKKQEEELRGERELTPGMERVVLTRPPLIWSAVIQEGKHGQRKPPGQGKRAKKVEEGVQQ